MVPWFQWPWPMEQYLLLVGGVGDYWSHQWNRATNPHTRCKMGSVFKPLVYLAALSNQRVIDSNSTIDDSPLTITAADGSSYTPRDFDGRYSG